MTPLKQSDAKYVNKYSITKKVGTANHESRFKSKNVQGSKANSIFDTPIIDMSVKGPSRAEKRSKGSVIPSSQH